MNKSDLIDAIAANSGLSKADAGRALDGVDDPVDGVDRRRDAAKLVVERREEPSRTPGFLGCGRNRCRAVLIIIHQATASQRIA